MPIGAAEVRAVFSSGSGSVAGCMVTEGKVVKDCGIRVLRKGKEVYVGVLDSLRRVKEIVKEVYAQVPSISTLINVRYFGCNILCLYCMIFVLLPSALTF